MKKLFILITFIFVFINGCEKDENKEEDKWGECNELWQTGSLIIVGKKDSEDSTYLYKVFENTLNILKSKENYFVNPNRPYFVPDGLDGFLYFDAWNSRGNIYGYCPNEYFHRLTEDPYGHSIDYFPRVSIQRKYMTFISTRTGSIHELRYTYGISQGPGFGNGLYIGTKYSFAWSPVNEDILWCRINDSTFSEFNISNEKYTGQNVSVKIKKNSIPSISPNGTLFAILQPDNHISIYDFDGNQKVKFDSVNSKNPSWSDNHTVYFANANNEYIYYKGDVNTGKISKFQLNNIKIIDLYAWSTNK